MSVEDDEAALAAAILSLTQARGPGRSICPSEAARSVDPVGWRALTPAVRRVAARLVADGRVRATQRGAPVDPLSARGPIRLSATVTISRRNSS